MRHSLILFLITFFFVFASDNLYSAKINSNGTGGGDWGVASSWSPAIVPSCGDTICIVANDVIHIKNDQDYSSPGCGSAMFITVDSLGTINFATNGKRLKLPCGSGVILNDGGSLTATGTGGGNSTFLEICGSTVWKKSDGNRSGPLVFGTPLPIELLSFKAHANESQIDLEWITASEINNDFFTVEKSVEGNIWETVSILSGAGNSNQVIQYFEVDYDPVVGLSYYRLKQTDYDGKYSYSNVVPVRYFSEGFSNGGISLFPMPVSSGDILNVQFNNINQSEVLVVIRDIAGKEYYSKIIINVEDDKLIGLPIDSNVPAGIYLITATSENEIYSQKLIIK